MQTPDQIIDFIDQHIGHMLDRPHMYASNPESFEDNLTTLDQLRHLIVSGSADGYPFSGYPAGSRWIAGWYEQEPDQRPQQPLAPDPDVVNELEETQVQRQALLRNPPMRTEP